MTTIDLADGRSLDIDDPGGDGAVLLFHHGTPGSLVPLALMRAEAERVGLRLVTYSRAGYGASSRRPGRSVADVVPDMDRSSTTSESSAASPREPRAVGRMRWRRQRCSPTGSPALS